MEAAQLEESFSNWKASNTYPLEPLQAQKQALGETTNYSGDKSSVPITANKNFQVQQPAPPASLRVETDISGEAVPISNTQASSPHRESSTHNRLNRNQLQLPKNLDGSDHLPWETEYRGKFDSQFEKWMARSLMQYPAFQNLMAGELLIKVRKHISAGKYDLKRRDELLIEWEAMESGTDIGEEAYGITAKAASRRAKIRSALYN